MNTYEYTPYPSKEPDYSNMTLREELETRFADLARQKIPECPTPATAERQNKLYNSSNNVPRCYGIFDGENFDLYKGNMQKYNLDAMSGQPEYQCRQYQNVPNKGPIPEGVYHMYQDQRQNIDFPRAAAGLVPYLKKGWKGSVFSWGLRRIPLVPDKNTNTYGRGGFFSHGGWAKSSAGCIDTPFQTHKISDFLDGCQYDVPVYVKYPKECW